MRKIIYTVSVNPGECFNACTESQKRYADRIGVDFLCRDKWENWNDDLQTDSEKRHIQELLKDYDKVLYLDADVFIKADALDIFDYYKDIDDFIIYNEAMFNGVNMDAQIKYCVNQYNINWHKTNGYYDWLNAGVMLCSKGHEKVFDYNPKNFFKFQNFPMIYDMPYMHKNIYDNNIKVHFMDERFNTMAYFKDTGDFIHFANVLDRDERIKEYA